MSYRTFNKLFIKYPSNIQVATDLDHAINLVRKYDPSGYLPGLLLARNDAKIGYFAVRAFWIQSGLKFQILPQNDSNISSRQVSGTGQVNKEWTPQDRVQYWKNGIEALYTSSSTPHHELLDQNPILRILKEIIQRHSLSKDHFDRIILGREKDIDRKQYPTMDSLMEHTEMSCGSLIRLILECSGITKTNDNDDIIYEVAKDIGITHGLANALRTSVPVASATGKIIIPQELCDKYGVKSPRYLLSALGMGDEECRAHLQSAVKDIVEISRFHLDKARTRRNDLLAIGDRGEVAVSAFLPALASETFLDRLERHRYDLTDRNLRSVGMGEHLFCTSRLIASSFRKSY